MRPPRIRLYADERATSGILLLVPARLERASPDAHGASGDEGGRIWANVALSQVSAGTANVLPPASRVPCARSCNVPNRGGLGSGVRLAPAR